jgi:hypothetical protein
MMKKPVSIIFFCLLLVGMPFAINSFPPMYIIAGIIGAFLLCLIFLKIIKPIWIVSIVFICSPFVDILRVTYFKNIPFMGVYQELILLFLIVCKIMVYPDRPKLWRFGFIDYLIISLIIWNFFQVIQSPSILGGLYVWRWYSIGPLTYLIFRFYSFTKNELAVIVLSICIGLAVAAILIFYQYFILGPEKVAQISRALGFTAFYRIGWRLPGPFSSPLVASASYSILVIFGSALFTIKRYQWVGICLIVIGGLAMMMTLSRSGIVISLVGLISIIIMNFQKIKYKILPAFLAILVILQFSYIIPETRPFLAYLTNTNLDSYDTYRLAEFGHIITDAVTKNPFGIGYAGGGAISQQAFTLFGGDPTYMPKYLAGDSVFFASLQTSGFLGLFLLVAIFTVFIGRSIRLLTGNLLDSQRIWCLVSLSFFLGTLVTLGNLIDVWPIKIYFWSFGAMVMSIGTNLPVISMETESLISSIPSASIG